MELAVLLPIAAFIALAAGLAVVLRGTGRIVARTRELEQFRAGVRDLAVRVDASLGAAAGQIDAVRRGHVGPDTIGETIIAATDAVDQYADEARSLPGPRMAQGIRADLGGELGPGELEAQTSIKRGYLNLIHARDAFARHAVEAEELEPDARRVGRRSA